MKPQFIKTGFGGKDIAVDKLEKIWKDWESFAAYAL